MIGELWDHWAEEERLEAEREERDERASMAEKLGTVAGVVYRDHVRPPGPWQEMLAARAAEASHVRAVADGYTTEETFVDYCAAFIIAALEGAER